MFKNSCALFNHLSKRYQKSSFRSAKDLLIYFDKGISLYSAMGCLTQFRHILRDAPINIKLISSHQIKHSQWENNTIALVLPGGRTKPHYHTLQENGNQRIANFVNQGGSYFGICAGAYYGSKLTEFERHTSLELVLEGPLNFYNGKAIGPAYGHGQFSYYMPKGAKAAKINWLPSKSDSSQFTKQNYVYYNGGCYFSDTSLDNRFKTIATYAELNNLPAAISGQVGNGKVILSGVHFETDYRMLCYYPYLFDKEIKRKLQLSKTDQQQMLTSILTDLGIPTINNNTTTCEITNNCTEQNNSNSWNQIR